jgi:hypothetical protein
MIGASTLRAKPVTEVGSDGVEIPTQSISRESRVAIRLQTHLEIVRESHGVNIFAMTQVKGRQDLGDWIDRQPQPHFASAPDATVELIHLDEDQHQIPKETIM